MKINKVLIAGCGYVGLRLAEMLHEQGVTVYAIRRNPPDTHPFIKWIKADLTDVATFPKFEEKPDVVFYCAAANGRSEQHYSGAYIFGPQHLISVLKEQDKRPDRFIYVSSTGVYSQTDGSSVDENSEAKPSYFGGQCIILGEKAVSKYAKHGIVVRFSGIYGPGRHRLIDNVVEGNPIDESLYEKYLNHIHLEDCAGALLHVAALEDPEDIYIATDYQPTKRSLIYSWISKVLNKPSIPLESEQDIVVVRRGNSNKRLSNKRLVDSGYEFKYPSYKEGYTKIMEDEKLV